MCCLPGEIWNDVPDKIGRSMGGQEFFFNEEARAIHRVGIGRGLGWRLPKYQQRKDRINHVYVYQSRITGLLEMRFCNSSENPEDGTEIILNVPDLQYADLRTTYEKVMYGH
jgi:hypothetical protein